MQQFFNKDECLKDISNIIYETHRDSEYLGELKNLESSVLGMILKESMIWGDDLFEHTDYYYAVFQGLTEVMNKYDKSHNVPYKHFTRFIVKRRIKSISRDNYKKLEYKKFVPNTTYVNDKNGSEYNLMEAHSYDKCLLEHNKTIVKSTVLDHISEYMKTIKSDKKRKALRMIAAGHRTAEIAEYYNVSTKTIQRWRQEMREYLLKFLKI